jgi:hypothetical protein
MQFYCFVRDKHSVSRILQLNNYALEDVWKVSLGTRIKKAPQGLG